MDKNKSPSKLKTDANFHELRSTLDDEIYRKWDQEQKFLRTKLKEVNDFDWSLQNETLKYIGGVDVSFSKVDKNLACSYLVVLEYPSLKIVYKDYEFVHLDLPYIPGFLAFREAPHLLKLIEKLKKTKSQFIPQVILVDGNGILHQNGFGLASHLGVLANIPTIGCGKTVFYVDGIGVEKVEKMSKENLHKKGDFFKIVGHSKRTWGAAVCTDKDDEPLIVSVGHRISLDTAIEVVKACSKTRIPEPIRIADQNSRYQMRDGTKKGVTDSTSARNEMTFIKGQETKAVAKKEAPKVVDDDGWIKVGK